MLMLVELLEVIIVRFIYHTHACSNVGSNYSKIYLFNFKGINIIVLLKITELCVPQFIYMIFRNVGI